MEAREYPKAVDAERALLGGLIQAPEWIDTIRESLVRSDFYRPDHGELYAILLGMADRGDAIDMVTIPETVIRLNKAEECGGLDYVIGLVGFSVTTANLPHYADTVRAKAQLRRVAKLLELQATEAKAETGTAEEIVSRVISDLPGLVAGSVSDEPMKAVGDLMAESLGAIMDRSHGIGSPVPTRFEPLDKILGGGLWPSDLVVLAARPAMGKTTLAMDIAWNVAEHADRGVVVFTLEMSSDQIVQRGLSRFAAVDFDRIRRGDLNDHQKSAVLRASERMAPLPVRVDQTGSVTVDLIRARAMRAKREDPTLAVVVIDYLQLFNYGESRENQATKLGIITRGLKVMAKDLGVTVVLLSQLNRQCENREDKRPMPSDLRDSGAIEQDADVVLLVYRDEVYNPDTPDKGIAELIVAKQRNGGTGTVRLKFEGSWCRFATER